MIKSEMITTTIADIIMNKYRLGNIIRNMIIIRMDSDKVKIRPLIIVRSLLVKKAKIVNPKNIPKVRIAAITTSLGSTKAVMQATVAAVANV